ncbi:signal peptidase complex subunit 2 [Monosporozyma unispora]|nr:hypothetical protein C6P44_001163 [Kazachstania unispora]
MSKPVNVYSIGEVAQRLDDEVPIVFHRLGYKQSFKLIDTKLIIGYSIAVVAGISFVLDKKLGHNNVIQYQRLLVAAYFILSGVFWYFKKFIEKSILYTGTNKENNQTINFKRDIKDGKPIYQTSFIIKSKDGEVKSSEVNLEINKVFNENGYLQTDLFFQWVKKQIENIESKKD